MMFAKLTAACVALSLVSPVPGAAREVEPASTEIALAREVVDLGFPVEGREAMFFATMEQLIPQMREATLRATPVHDAGALAILDSWIERFSADSKVTMSRHIPKLMDAIALAYAGMFTETELRDLKAFLASPSGRGFLQRSSGVLANPHFAAANQEYMNAITAALPKAKAELRAELESYFASQQASLAEVD